MSENTVFETPHSVEMEEAVLGVLLFAPECYREVSYLTGQSFFIHRNRFIWQAMTRINERQEHMDIIILANELSDMGRLDEIGGQACLTALMNNVGSSLGLEDYADVLESFRIKRAALTYCNTIATAAMNGKTGLEVLGMMQAGISEIQVAGVRAENVLRQSISSIYDAVTSGQTATKYIPTGIPYLDDILGGWAQDKLYYVSGRPGQGKSALLIQSALCAAKDYGQRVGFFSAEMNVNEITVRLLSQIARIDSKKIERSRLAESDWPAFTAAIETLQAVQDVMDIHHVPGLTISELRRAMERERYDAVFVDYIGLMVGDRKTENKIQELTYISNNLKILAGVYHCPVICAAQMSRDFEKRGGRPRLSDLRDCGSLEQDGDVVMFVYAKENDADKDKTDLTPVTVFDVAKQRGGAVESRLAIFEKQFVSFKVK